MDKIKIKKTKITSHIYFRERYSNGELVSSCYEVSYNQVSGIKTSRSFDSLEKAKEFESYLIQLKDKVRADKSLTEDCRNYKFVNDIYPENLLSQIEITPEEFPNYYDYIIPNFESNVEKITSLIERERRIIQLRFKDMLTLDAISKIMGVTPERIRQLLWRGLRKIRCRRSLLTQSPTKQELLSIEETNALKQQIREELTYEEARKIVLEYEQNHDVSEPILKDMQDTVYDMGLSVRTINCLRRYGCKTVEDVVHLPYNDLYKIRNMGKTSITELCRILKSKYNYAVNIETNKFERI